MSKGSIIGSSIAIFGTLSPWTLRIWEQIDTELLLDWTLDQKLRMMTAGLYELYIEEVLMKKICSICSIRLFLSTSCLQPFRISPPCLPLFLWCLPLRELHASRLSRALLLLDLYQQESSHSSWAWRCYILCLQWGCFPCSWKGARMCYRMTIKHFVTISAITFVTGQPRYPCCWKHHQARCYHRCLCCCIQDTRHPCLRVPSLILHCYLRNSFLLSRNER